ncbi:MAG: HzsA-related protein, partial [Planctomycetota bacterium]
EDLPRLLALLQHPEGWVRINAAKTIAWLGDPAAIEPLAGILSEAKAEADFGYNGTFKNEEYNDPAPRWREALLRALGQLGADQHTELIVRILQDERSVVEVRQAAAEALADLGNRRALAALRRAAHSHSFRCVRHIARDALWTRGISVAYSSLGLERGVTGFERSGPSGRRVSGGSPTSAPRRRPPTPATPREFEAIVFIKGSNNIPNTIGTVEQADRWRQTYAVTDSGPAYRPGRNLYVLRPPRPDGKVAPLTRFADGYVAEPELSWDGTQVIFTRRAGNDPWWHVYRINVDGTALTRLTDGPYHHVGPAYLPDGRIVLASSRSGIRDEYHGYPCTALYVMEPDGGRMQPIATNIGRDNEPAVLADGRIAFSRLEVFYSRNKTELTLHAAHADGTQDVVLYGPERRQFWRGLDHGPRSPADGQEAPLTHRVLRMTQPQPMPEGRHVVVVTQGGLTLIGPRRTTEEIITPDNKTRSYTTPFPLPDGRVLCASTLKTPDRKQVDLGLYALDPATKRLELIYNDPDAADFEPRPIMVRPPPMVQPDRVKPGAYSGRFICSSVFATQEKDVPVRGRLVRLIEGVPRVARHSTHTNPWEVWKNHGGTFARVLGTAPLAPDGSFYVEVPADRLMHFQILDSDRRVVGNQLTWIYARPGETKSCVGCHEAPHTTTRGNNPLATHYPPLKFLPAGDEFSYRAKAWFKGHLPAEIDERTRTVRAVNLMGR